MRTVNSFLDPYHDHGLGFEVLKRVVTQAFPGSPLLGAIEDGEYSGLVIRERGQLEIVVELEREVTCNEHNRSIDILVTVGEKYLLAIENKTSESSMQKNQVREEAIGLQEHEKLKDREMYFIYLVPEAAKTSAEQEIATIPKNILSTVITWNGQDSIVALLQGILADDSLGKTSAIPTESVFLIKSFTRFATNEFTYYLGAKKTASTSIEYDQIVQGFLDVTELGKEGFIGYYGGKSVLNNDLEEAKANLAKRQRLISERPYKWVRTLDDKHINKGNWIPITEFKEMFEASGLV